MVDCRVVLMEICHCDKDFLKYLLFDYLYISINFWVIIYELEGMCETCGYVFPLNSSLLKLNICIPIPWYHVKCMYEVVNPFLSRIFLPCYATMLNMFNMICQSYILATNITNLFSKSNCQQSSTLWPFGDRLFMCTPPSSERRFQHQVQGRQ